MSELLEQIVGWLGYLERSSVQIQLALILLAMAAPRLSAVLVPRTSFIWPHRWPKGSMLTLIILVPMTLGLALLGMAYGLVLFFLQAVAGWKGLSLLRRSLRRVIHPRHLQSLDSRLIRPIYLVVVGLALVREFDNPTDLALISMGKWFGAEVTLGQILLVGLIVYLLAVGGGPPSEGLAWMVQRGVGVSDSSRRAMALMIRYTLVGLGIIWALTFIGFNSTAILAVAGGLSVGLGFGVKEVFSNFVSGLWLLFEGSVRPGDVLLLDGDPCQVRRLGLRAAVLFRDRDNSELVIPNQIFFTSTTTTYTGSDGLRRSQVLVSAAYRHRPRQVISLLEQTAGTCEQVMREPAPRGLLLSYGDSSILYALRFYIADPMKSLSISSDVQASVWEAFQAQGIEIPFPQRVNHRAPPPGAALEVIDDR